MKITYDPNANAAFINLRDSIGAGGITRTDVADLELDGAAIIFGFGKDGRLLQLEVLGADRVLPEELLRTANRSS